MDKNLSAAISGDTAAYDQIVSVYLTDVYRYLMWLTKDSTLAEDAAQETFIKAWQNLPKFDRSKSFKPWLLRIARNTALDHVRRKRFTPFTRLSESEQHFIQNQADPSPSPEQHASQNETSAKVKHTLNSLPSKYREILILHYLEGYSATEISDILHKSQETIRTRLRRARALFRTRYSRTKNPDTSIHHLKRLPNPFLPE